MFDLTRRQSISHFMLAIDIGRFIELERFKGLASLLSEYVKNAAKAEGVTELYLPGEIEFKAEEKRMVEGIPIDDKVVDELRELATSLGVSVASLSNT